MSLCLFLKYFFLIFFILLTHPPGARFAHSARQSELCYADFAAISGRRHGGEKNENKLICYRDRTYIELITLINDDPRNRLGHWWDKDYGIFDFSFAHSDGEPTSHFLELEKRLKGLEWEKGAMEVEYQPPQAGAWIRPEGQEIKWQVTFPEGTTVIREV
jgi:hypothetical protein